MHTQTRVCMCRGGGLYAKQPVSDTWAWGEGLCILCALHNWCASCAQPALGWCVQCVPTCGQVFPHPSCLKVCATCNTEWVWACWVRHVCLVVHVCKMCVPTHAYDVPTHACVQGM